MSESIYPIPIPWRGHLSIVPRPRGGDWLDDEVNGWRRGGIETVISLLEPDEAQQLDLAGEGDAAEAGGVRFVSFPIPDRGVPESASAALVLMAEIAAALEDGKHIALHCRQSVGRAGMMAAAVLIAAGADPERAMGVVSAARGADVPETAEQREWLRRLPVRQSAGLAL
jgi:protein-tyrosine phosphatase